MEQTTQAKQTKVFEFVRAQTAQSGRRDSQTSTLTRGVLEPKLLLPRTHMLRKKILKKEQTAKICEPKRLKCVRIGSTPSYSHSTRLSRTCTLFLSLLRMSSVPHSRPGRFLDQNRTCARSCVFCALAFMLSICFMLYPCVGTYGVSYHN